MCSSNIKCSKCTNKTAKTQVISEPRPMANSIFLRSSSLAAINAASRESSAPSFSIFGANLISLPYSPWSVTASFGPPHLSNKNVVREWKNPYFIF